MRKIYLFLLTLLCAVGASAQVSFDTSKTYYLIEKSTRRAVATGVSGADGAFGLAAAETTGDEFVLTPAGNGFVITSTSTGNKSLGNNHNSRTTNDKTIWVIEESETETGWYTLKAYNTAKSGFRYLNYQTAQSSSLYADAASNSTHKLLFQFRETGNTPHTVVYKYQIGEEVKRYTRHFVEAGSEFPAVELPKGISGSKPSGNVMESDYRTEKVIECTETARPLFETASTVAGITKWYAVKINPNDARNTKYLKSNASNQVAVTDATIDYLNSDAYLWGFVGDAFGVKMVNKATGKAVVSTGSGAVSLQGEPDYLGTAFIYASSTQPGDIFCLKHPTMPQYLNGQGGLIKHYGSNDGGSSFKLVEISNADMVSGIKAALRTLLDREQTNIGKPGYFSQTEWDNADALVKSEESTVEQLKNAMSNLYSNVSLPTPGKFYRFKSKLGRYINASSNGNKFAMATLDDNTYDNASVFYLTPENKFLNFKSGTYLKETHTQGNVGDGGNVITFHPSEGRNYGFLTLKSDYTGGGQYLYDNTTILDRNSSYATGNCDWTVEEVGWLPVPMNKTVGYATLFSPVQLALSYNRVEAYAVSEVTSTSVKLQSLGNVPANVGVILKLIDNDAVDARGCVFLQVTGSGATSTSKLNGTLASEKITGDAYVLAIVEGNPGFYKAEKNHDTGTKWINNGFKAYLRADLVTGGGSGTGARVLTFDFDDNAETGINAVEIEEAAPANAAIYDLSGRRVQSAKSGLYIINGKKVIK